MSSKAEKSQNMQSASCRFRTAGGVAQSGSRGLRNRIVDGVDASLSEGLKARSSKGRRRSMSSSSSREEGVT